MTPASVTSEYRLTAWFPLVARPRPPAGPLPDRIDQIGDLARAAAQAVGSAAVTIAAEALNKAALIASDCGEQELATQLCWRQFETFAAAAPLDLPTAKTAVQPIINLGRLLTRARQPDRAHDLFQSAFTAADTAAPALIDGRAAHIAALIHAEDRPELRRYLWLVLLAEGTRALTTAGRWSQALTVLTRYNGIASRLLDGRQVAIIERLNAADQDGALEILTASTPVEPWEKAVAKALQAMCLPAGGPSYRGAAAEAADQFRELTAAGGLEVFHTRLGLIVLQLADTAGLDAAGVADTVLQTSLTAADANIARDVLDDPVCGRYLSPGQSRILAGTLESSGIGLGLGSLQRERLTAHARTARSALEAALRQPWR